MSPKKAKRANELPYIPLGPFQWRIPGIHYRVEYVEFFQGLILGATALSSIPYLTDNLVLPYERAWSCVIIEVFMLSLIHILHLEQEQKTQPDLLRLSKMPELIQRLSV